MRKLLIALAAVGMLAGSACGGGSSDKTTTTTAKGAVAPTVVIKSEGTTWSPNDVTIKVGDTVEWDVDGSIVHDLRGDENITHSPGSKFTATHKYTTAGTFAYQCTIHAGMNGTITVS
jgi:plastocyanin